MNARTSLLVLLLLALPLALTGCGGGGSGPSEILPYVGEIPDDTTDDVPPPTPEPPPTEPPPTEPTPPGSTTTQPIVPTSATPPIGLTLKVGYAENANTATLQTLYSKFVALNTALWNVTEGQVYVYEVVITDNVAPGTSPNQWQSNKSLFDTSNFDVVMWPSSAWDLGSAAGVVWWSSPPQFGRTGRLMLIPANASTHTILHETGHLSWNLSWTNSFGLDDEYVDGVQDPACVMESWNPPQRWCSDANHVSQSSVPHACWHQILLDYTNFSHQDKDTASTTAWTPTVTYNDAP